MEMEAQKLNKVVKEFNQAGLEDVKFLFGPLDEKTQVDVWRSMRQALEAVRDKRYTAHVPLGDSHKTA